MYSIGCREPSTQVCINISSPYRYTAGKMSGDIKAHKFVSNPEFEPWVLSLRKPWVVQTLRVLSSELRFWSWVWTQSQNSEDSWVWKSWVWTTNSGPKPPEFLTQTSEFANSQGFCVKKLRFWSWVPKLWVWHKPEFGSDPEFSDPELCPNSQNSSSELTLSFIPGLGQNLRVHKTLSFLNSG